MMAAINRSCSPMVYAEENLDETREQTIQRRKKLEESQKVKSPFLIGSIEEVNRKISHLDRKLQSYTDLVVESQSSDHTDGPFHISIHAAESSVPEKFLQREREIKEVNQFAGIYAIKSTFLSKPSERTKNITKISMDPSKIATKKDTGKPKFFELHQYAGYDSHELTPLPNNVTAIDVLNKVANAQPNIKNMSQYRPEFERLFFSQMSQAVLQDTFWWVFLERWQPSRHYQQKLFNRIAFNYVKLMTYAKHPIYRNTFLKNYPSLLSQAVYAAFCAAFPDSYKQFEDDFKEAVIGTVYEWIAGARPLPRSYRKWITEKLEPDGLKNREELMNQSKSSNKSSLLDLSFLDSQISASQSTLNHLGSMSSVSSMGPSKRHTQKRHQLPSTVSLASSMEGSEPSGVINEVARAQPHKASTSMQSLSPSNGSSQRTPKSKLSRSKDRLIDGNRTKAMTPIREFEEDNQASKSKHLSMGPSKGSKTSSKSSSKSTESHVVGRGPEFIKTAFNMNGHSPLVAHFLTQMNLQRDSGMHVRVQRTEVSKLPPLETQTYRQLIQECFKKVREIEKDYDKMAEKGQEDSCQFVRQQKAALKDYLRKQASLMAKPREVKRLSDLILLELKKDKDSLTAGAAAAIEQALLAEP